MFKLLKKASENDANVHVNMNGKEVHHADDSDDAEDAEEHHSDDASDWSDDAEDNLADYLMEGEDHSEDNAAYLDDHINNMRDHSGHDMANDMVDKLMRANEGSEDTSNFEAKASDVRLMQGLGKIEASLRRKGEGFAADLVRSTALSIQDDIVKEAAQKTQVLRELVKMASDLDRRGNREASKLVRSTIMKINR
jgi:hypothetical protein